jgi:hypothetical protein
MNVANADSAAEAKPEKNFRRVNIVGTAAGNVAPNSGSFPVGPTGVGSKVQKIGGGGYISRPAKKAPRPQSLLPSLSTSALSLTRNRFHDATNFGRKVFGHFAIGVSYGQIYT